MNKLILKPIAVLCILLLALNTILHAEEKQAPKKDDPVNVVKLNLSTLVWGNIGLQYERALTDNISVALGVSTLINRNLPITRFYTFESTVVNESSIGGFSITPEVRFYMGKKAAPSGFYIAPYLRYNNYTMTFDVDSEVDYKDGRKDILTNFVGTGKYTSIGGGLMIGAQWIVAKRVSIDWWILGLGFNSTKMSASSKGDFSKLDLSNTVNEINNFEGDLFEAKGKANDKEISAELSLPGVSLRGALTVGFAF
jgi:hypothetical protein